MIANEIRRPQAVGNPVRYDDRSRKCCWDKRKHHRVELSVCGKHLDFSLRKIIWKVSKIFMPNFLPRIKAKNVVYLIPAISIRSKTKFTVTRYGICPFPFSGKVSLSARKNVKPRIHISWSQNFLLIILPRSIHWETKRRFSSYNTFQKYIDIFGKRKWK